STAMIGAPYHPHRRIPGMAAGRRTDGHAKWPRHDDTRRATSELRGHHRDAGDGPAQVVCGDRRRARSHEGARSDDHPRRTPTADRPAASEVARPPLRRIDETASDDRGIATARTKSHHGPTMTNLERSRSADPAVPVPGSG